MPDQGSVSAVGGESQEIAGEVSSNLQFINESLDGKGGEGAREAKGTELAETEETETSADDAGEGDEEQEAIEEGAEEGEEEVEEDAGGDEERDELAEAESPRLLKQLNAKYPKLLKEFPVLKDALAREQEFSEVFVTPEDAVQTYETMQHYRQFEEALYGEEPEFAIEVMRDTNVEGFNRFADSFLPTLAQLDSNAYSRIVSPAISQTLRKALAFGQAHQNQNLINAVAHIAATLWPEGKGKLPDAPQPRRMSDEERIRTERLDERERQLNRQDEGRFINVVRTTTNRNLIQMVTKGLDPKNTLLPFLRDTVVEKTVAEIKHVLDVDESFGRAMHHLMQKARRSGYSDEFKTRMTGTYLARVKSLIGPVRQKYLNQALGVRTKTTTGANGDGKIPLRRSLGQAPPGSRTGGRAVRSSEIDFSRTSDLDILSGKASLKKR